MVHLLWQDMARVLTCKHLEKKKPINDTFLVLKPYSHNQEEILTFYQFCDRKVGEKGYGNLRHHPDLHLPSRMGFLFCNPLFHPCEIRLTTFQYTMVQSLTYTSSRAIILSIEWGTYHDPSLL